ncbi:MAG TPA: biotin/lipoyl-containing protein [Anaeromyxobacteraceae bacterium]|nr:biotin/lipoyl-containing protein [Anaeromyxobacteraceae bacterium]
MKLKLTVDGKVYEVDVEALEAEPPRPVHVPPQSRLPAAVPAAAPAGPDRRPGVDESRVCRSPISGTVVRVVAQAGQELKVGDVLLVLEAMKMETNVTAPLAARVSRVNAKIGESVKTGQVVAEFS